MECELTRNPGLCAQVSAIRAVNLGNALEAPAEGQWGVTLRRRDFVLIADAGFSAVRVPIRWSAHAAAEPPYAVKERFFGRIDWVLEQSRENGLLAIINMHHYDELFTNPPAHEARFLAIWQQIAERYAAVNEEDLWFEILNEPHGALTSGAWNRLLARTMPVVRATNPTRPVVVGGPNWNSFNSMSAIDLPPDDVNIVLTFHYYNPFAFTHQGAAWVDRTDLTGVPWNGSIGSREAIDIDFFTARRQAQAHGLPVLLGEFGAYQVGDMDSRARWTHYVRASAEANNMGWAYWEFRAGFGVYDGDALRWNRPLLEALIPDQGD